MKKKKINTKLPVKLSRKYLVITAIVIGVVGLLYFFKGMFIVGWVNGRPLTRVSYNRELEKLAKTQAFDSLTTKQLIIAEAKKQNVSVSKAEVDESMTNIDARAKEQGSSLDELLTAQGVKRQDVEEEVRLQKLLEKLVGPSEVTDEQIQAYWDQNKDLFAGQTLDDVKGEIAGQLQQQTTIGKIQELITRLQTEANIVKW